LLPPESFVAAAARLAAEQGFGRRWTRGSGEGERKPRVWGGSLEHGGCGGGAGTERETRHRRNLERPEAATMVVMGAVRGCVLGERLWVGGVYC